MNNQISFSQEHLATVFKYSGISFIAGAVNHGFFSEDRSILTAALGIVFFSVGIFLEFKKNHHTNLVKDLAFSAVFSIGLGFFTGGLQHFPDSPNRSAWVVPLGFVLSLIALLVTRPKSELKQSIAYSILSILLITTGSFGFYTYLKSHESEDVVNSHEEVSQPNDHHDKPGTPAHTH